jgi:beta-barrel assembly-enhancing protease
MDLASKRDDNKGSSLQQLIPKRVHTWDKGTGDGVRLSAGGVKKVYIMRSAIRFLSVGALALMLAQLGVAQSQGSSTQGSSTPSASGQDTSQGSSTQSGGSDGQYMPEKPSKNAPSPSTMDNLDAIGNRNVGCKEGVGNWYSLEKQVAMGRSYSQQVEHGAKMVSDPVITEYVNRVGQNLVRNSDAKVPFTIKVIDTDEINAFALPGGFFYVNSGLILAADNEAELAGVMAHEIGHVAACHVAREQTRGNIVNLASIPLIFVPGGWAVYEGTQAAMGIGVPLTFMKFSRTFESEADFLGMEYMYKAGYDPQSFISFFEKIEAQEKKKPGTLAKAFASHPMTPDRVAAAQKEMQTVLPARPEYIVDTSEFEQVKSRLASLENRHKVQNDNSKDRPTLRRATADNPTNGTGSGSGSQSGSSSGSGDDDRPTLKRSDGSQSLQ